MRKQRMYDYSRVDEYLDTIESDIEFEYGKKYDDLDREDQRDALLDHFFKGLPQYRQSAEELRIGIDRTKETGEKDVSVSTFKLRGKEHRVIRGSDGRFRQWVKE